MAKSNGSKCNAYASGAIYFCKSYKEFFFHRPGLAALRTAILEFSFIMIGSYFIFGPFWMPPKGFRFNPSKEMALLPILVALIYMRKRYERNLADWTYRQANPVID